MIMLSLLDAGSVQPFESSCLLGGLNLQAWFVSLELDDLRKHEGLFGSCDLILDF